MCDIRTGVEVATFILFSVILWTCYLTHLRGLFEARHTQTAWHSLAKGLVHEVVVVDLDDALVLLEQSLLP